MKVFHIAFKDLKQATRSYLALAMMVGVPILITGMFALLFGGSSGEDSETFDLPVTPVTVANLDEGSLGEILAETLGGGDLSGLLDVTAASTAEDARALVDSQQAAAAVIIPASLTESLYSPGGQAVIEIYQDPTLSLGPGIVTMLVSQLADGFSGYTITVEVVNEQLSQAGMALTNQQIMQIVAQYQQEQNDYGALQGTIQTQNPGGEEQVNGGIISMLAMVMGGMTIFYSFFTGTNAANSLLTEEDNQTLARMLTTATSPVQVIGGKLLAGAAMIVVQITFLFLFGHYVFSIQWGNLQLLPLFILGVTIGAVTFGLFAISWAKDRKQAGLIIGGGVTITGMLGIASIFMANSPNPNQAINSLSLLVPQGWANRALVHIMYGYSTSEVYISLLGLLAYSAVLFYFGFRRIIRRFA